jgi:L,D-peptidoglycan transpeptidase YkuD (ErfK/YbiS/YcfS/YnhG family)
VHLVCGDWWDEDPVSADYNLFEQVTCGTIPSFAQGADGSGSEALWTETVPYPSFAYIEYNLARVPWVGSAIFLAATTGYPTVGCVAVAASSLDAVLEWMSPADSPRIVIGTTQDITSY